MIGLALRQDSHFRPLYSRPAWESWEPLLRVTDRLTRAIVYVGRQPPHGRFMAYGTGFAVFSNIGDATYQNIATAKHVIDRIPGDTVHLRVNTKAGPAEVVPTSKEMWFPHPDKNIDLAVAPTTMPLDHFDLLHIVLKEGVLLTPERIAEHKVGIGDNIAVTGLYVARMGEHRNLPIIRSGIIAAMPTEKIRTSYGYHDAYLVETRSIDGLSGSPVFVQLRDPRAPGSDMIASEHFLGVLLGANWVETHDDAIEIVEGDDAPHETPPTGALNTGIGVVLPGHYIHEAIEQPKLRGPREDRLKEKGDRYFRPSGAGSSKLDSWAESAPPTTEAKRTD